MISLAWLTVFNLEGGTAHVSFTPRAWGFVNISVEMTGWSTWSHRGRRETTPELQVNDAWWGITITQIILFIKQVPQLFFLKKVETGFILTYKSDCVQGKTHPYRDRQSGSPHTMCSHLHYSNPETRTKALKIFLITLVIVSSIWELKTLYSLVSGKQITYKENIQDNGLSLLSSRYTSKSSELEQIKRWKYARLLH